jgi:hypothetical protein
MNRRWVSCSSAVQLGEQNKARDAAERRALARVSVQAATTQNFEDAMRSIVLASLALLVATALPVQAGNTSSNSSSNTSCNSSNGRTTCLHTHDWSITTSGNRTRSVRGATHVEHYVPLPERYWRDRRDRRWQFDDDD